MIPTEGLDFRFEVHDEDGCLRKFYKREDAWRFMRNRPELKLVVAPRINRFQQLLKSVGEALF
jgi:hypothetical protein